MKLLIHHRANGENGHTTLIPRFRGIAGGQLRVAVGQYASRGLGFPTVAMIANAPDTPIPGGCYNCLMAQLPTAAQVQARLRDSFALDELWGLTMGLPDGDTKEAALRQLVDLLEKERVRYAVIGGIAVQLYTEEPRTTRDIDIALASYEDLPRIALERAGFEHEGRFEHSDNWRAPGSAPRKQRTAIQFMADQLTPGSVERAQTFDLPGMRLRVAKLPDLVLLKLEAAEEPRRRPSKRRSDAADVSRLLEEHPELEQELPGVRERLAYVDDMIRGK